MIEKIFLGLVITLLGTLILYAFRVRQLYVVVPRLFSSSELTSTGKLVELRIFNRGRVTEEDIDVSLSPDRKYEIVASTDTSPTLSGNYIKIPRVPAGNDISILMMVEGGDFSKNEISTISSKVSKGKIIDLLEGVPPNYGNFAIAFFTLVLLLSSPFAGINYYYDWKEKREISDRSERLSSLKYLENVGWSKLDRYSESQFRKNYANGEFPIYEKEIIRKGDVVLVTFGVVNKAAAPLKIELNFENPYRKNDPRPWENSFSGSVSAFPASASELQVRIFWPEKVEGEINLSFMFFSGTDHMFSVDKKLSIAI